MKTIKEMREIQNAKITKVEEYLTNKGKAAVVAIMNKEEKLMFFENFLNDDNKFCNVVELPSQWVSGMLNLLCDTDEIYNLYMNKYHKKNQVFKSTMDFREHLRKNGRGKVQVQDLTKALLKDDDEALHSLLQELFLEPLKFDLRRFKQELQEGLTLEEVVRWCEEGNSNFVRFIITSPKRYVNGEWISKKEYLKMKQSENEKDSFNHPIAR